MTIRKITQWVFTALAFVGAVLVIVAFALPFYQATSEVVGIESSLTVTGFAFAFGGNYTATVAGATATDSVELSAGVLSAFILAVVGLVLLVIHPVFSYGKTPAVAKKGLAVVIFLVFGVLTGLLFSTLPLVGEESSEFSNVISNGKAGLGSGAILGGVFSAVVALLALLSAVVAPDTAK